MKLLLPPAGRLQPNSAHDPLPYYYRPVAGWLYRHRLQLGLDLLRKGRRNVLEIGVGSGILVPTLTARFPAYTGLDLALAPGLASLVAPGCDARFLRADLLEPNALPAGAFDTVVCLSVLEHIADADGAAAALARVLAPGGTLVTGYPMVNRLMRGLFRAIGFANIDDHHVTTPAEIDRALRRVLRPVARKALPPLAPVPLALYQCTAWCQPTAPVESRRLPPLENHEQPESEEPESRLGQAVFEREPGLPEWQRQERAPRESPGRRVGHPG